MNYGYEIKPRPLELGGGWRLYLLEDGRDVGGGIFPCPGAEKEQLAEAYTEALSEAQAWLSSRERD